MSRSPSPRRVAIAAAASAVLALAFSAAGVAAHEHVVNNDTDRERTLANGAGWNNGPVTVTFEPSRIQAGPDDGPLPELHAPGLHDSRELRPGVVRPGDRAPRPRLSRAGQGRRLLRGR